MSTEENRLLLELYNEIMAEGDVTPDQFTNWRIRLFHRLNLDDTWLAVRLMEAQTIPDLAYVAGYLQGRRKRHN